LERRISIAPLLAKSLVEKSGGTTWIRTPTTAAPAFHGRFCGVTLNVTCVTVVPSQTTLPELAAEGKLYAHRHAGLWLTVNTPKDLRVADDHLRAHPDWLTEAART